MKKISFFAKNSERKFAVIIQILVVIHKLLGSNSTSTKRELYYNDPEFFQNQDTVDRAISDISCLLNANPWEFAIIPSSKGLVAGDLKVVTADSNIVDFATSGAVPSDVTGIKSFESAAKFILVVEKDTVFQRLLNLKVFLRINKKIILITVIYFIYILFDYFYLLIDLLFRQKAILMSIQDYSLSGWSRHFAFLCMLLSTQILTVLKSCSPIVSGHW